MKLRPVTALHAEGALSASYLILTQGPVFVAMALLFGLDPELIGVAGAFPMAFQLFQLATPMILRPGARLKTLLALFNAVRFVWAALIVIAVRGAVGPSAFLIVFAVAQAANALAGNVWMMLVQRIVPDPLRGRYLARRNVYISVLTVMLVPLYSALLSALPHPAGVIAVISLALLGTTLSVLFVLPLPDYRRLPPRSLAPVDAATEESNAGNFRRLGRAHAYWSFAIMLTAPFFTYHQIENVGIPLIAISVQTSAFAVLSAFCYRLWGGLTDRLGIKSITIAGISIVSATPWLWLLMVERLWPLAMVLDVLNSSLGWAAMNIVILAFPMETGRRGAPGDFAVYFALGGIGGLVGSVAGGYLAAAFHDVDLYIGSYHVYGLQLFLLLGGVLRLTSIPLFLRVQTRKYVPLPAVAMNALAVIARRTPLRPFEGVRPNGMAARRLHWKR